jgi:hypothetical protein
MTTTDIFKKRYYNHKTSLDDSSYVKFGIWKTRNKNLTSNGPFWSKPSSIKKTWKLWKVTGKNCWTGDVNYSRSVITESNYWQENLKVRTQYHHATSLTNSTPRKNVCACVDLTCNSFANLMRSCSECFRRLKMAVKRSDFIVCLYS